MYQRTQQCDAAVARFVQSLVLDILMQRWRRATDYSLRLHISEQLFIRLQRNSWPARLAYRLGLQRHLSVTQHTVTLPTPHWQRPPLRLLFASDFHAGPTTHPQFLAHVCQQMQLLKPDLVLFGGDFVSGPPDHIQPLATLLGHIPAPLGRFAVLGNHDLWANDYPIRDQLQRQQIQVLVNANIRLPPPYDDVWVCGLDDPDAGTPDLAATFADAEGIRLLLMHSPQGLPHLDGHSVELVLCGHTHGGQIALPNGRPILLPKGKLNRRYPVGRFTLSTPHQTLIVSRGVGFGGLPLRLFAPSEIIICTLAWTHCDD